MSFNCLKSFKPEMAACNAGSLNYLKCKKDGSWAWPPILFDNPVEKINFFFRCNVRTGLEDTFYLPNEDRAETNGQLLEAFVKIVRKHGKEPATAKEARNYFGLL